MIVLRGYRHCVQRCLVLSADVNPSDGSLSDLTDVNDVPNHAQIDDYGYGSDSDLDDDSDPVPIQADKEGSKKKSATASRSSLKISITTQRRDDDE